MRDAIKLSGLPAVFINSSVRGEPVDYIIQDNFSGGSIAADYLLGRGHTRVAWFGQVGESHHSLERFAGAGSTLTNRGHRFDSELIVNPDTRNLREAAHEMLANSKRPTGVLALWTDFARTCAEVAVERGLRLGEDIEIVAWNYETAYQKDPSNGFPGGHIPPTIVWNPYSMARIAISRLLWHLKEPDLDPLKIMIPTKLMLPEN
jgi:DNA-binding LacI/PurR family transcriptional regulator